MHIWKARISVQICQSVGYPCSKFTPWRTYFSVQQALGSSFGITAEIKAFWAYQTPVIYKLAANTISRLITLDAVSIFLYRAELPIIAAAFLNSRHVSSNLTIVLTITPSGTSVSSQISANGVPCKKGAELETPLIGEQKIQEKDRIIWYISHTQIHIQIHEKGKIIWCISHAQIHIQILDMREGGERTFAHSYTTSTKPNLRFSWAYSWGSIGSLNWAWSSPSFIAVSCNLKWQDNDIVIEKKETHTQKKTNEL